MILYRVVRALIAGFSRLYWRLSIEGREHVPAEGPFVLAPVHRSNVDFAIASTVTKRRMRFMGKDSLFKVKPFAAFISALGAYPVHRGAADREALRLCIEMIGGGSPVVMFPEGTRRSGPVVEDLFDGPAYVAARAGVPIVPMGIGGSERMMPKGAKVLRPSQLVLIIGAPLQPPEVAAGGKVSRRAIREVTAKLQVEVQRLFDEAQAQAG